MKYTLDTLFERVKPDLVTISGDLAWCGDCEAIESMANALDGYGVPYSVVWGNHDQDGGIERLDSVIKCLEGHNLFLYENGPCELGRGNYSIGIFENGKLLHGIIMMDTHNTEPYVNDEGKETKAWAKLSREQLVWYCKEVKRLNSLGCRQTTLITHIPIYAYNYAWNAAFKEGLEPQSISPEESCGTLCWNEGYEESFGVMYEGICSYPADEHAFDVIKELGSTKNIICGHDHTCNFSVPYEGVRFNYALKTGAGCYWNPILNGGSVLTVNGEGQGAYSHEYVDIAHILVKWSK